MLFIALATSNGLFILEDNIITCFKDKIMLFIALATLNRLFVLKNYIIFNIINYKNYN